MATLFRKTHNDITFGCYSERGIMSNFMFRVLPTRFLDFLNQIQFVQDVQNPLKPANQPTDVVLFSELDFGNQGFGKPDGAVSFTQAGRRILMLIEVKLNQSYKQACRDAASYNSTIRGQLELKWRLFTLFTTGNIQDICGVRYIIENDRMITFYRDKDCKYDPCCNLETLGLDGRRRLRLTEGVGDFFDSYVRDCKFKDIFYLTVTDDSTNPLEGLPQLMPRCCDANGETAAGAVHQLCWMNKGILEEW